MTAFTFVGSMEKAAQEVMFLFQPATKHQQETKWKGLMSRDGHHGYRKTKFVLVWEEDSRV